MDRNISDLKDRYNWLDYKLFCCMHGLTEGSFESMRKWYKQICQLKIQSKSY